MSDGLTLEKMKVVERLEKLETSIAALDKTVGEVSTILFGEKGDYGVVHQLREINKLINATKNVMGKIFMALLGIIGVALFPVIIEILNKALKHG